MREQTPLAFLLLTLAATAQAPQLRARLEGEVLSPTSEPVANAEVTVEHDGVVVATARSDGNGTFIFPEVPAQFVTVRATTDAPDVGGVLIDAWGEGRAFARVYMMPARKVSGVVRDDQGEPCAGAWVTASSTISLANAHDSIRTDEHGRYQLLHAPAGRIHVRAWSAEHDAEAFCAIATGSEDVNLDCIVNRDRAEWVTFKLENATDAQRAKAELRVLAYCSSAQIMLPPELQRPQQTKPGEWQLRGWPRDDSLCAWLVLDGATSWPAEHVIDAGIGSTTRRFLIDDPDSVIYGKLCDAGGKPAPGVALMVQPLQGLGAINSRRHTTVTAADGTFSVQSPVNADSIFALRSLSFTSVLVGNDPNPVWFTGRHYRNQRWDITTCPADSITVRLSDAHGAPAAGVITTLWQTPTNGQAEQSIGVGTSGLDGRVDCRSLRLTPPLEVNVRTIGPAGMGEAQRKVANGGEVILDNLVLEPTCTLSGLVNDENGEPVAGVWVAVRVRGQTSWGMFTDRQGRFVRRGLPATICHLYAMGNPDVAVQPVSVTLEVGARNEVLLEITR